jgi:K+-sensing histidine kinase KdpD
MLSEYSITTDAQGLKRIFENLFSNIHKYADKSAPVSILCEVCECKLLLTITNKVDKNKGEVESNHIGLRTCKKISERIGVTFKSERDGDFFNVKMQFNIKRR